ncbi:hypothetical protein [Cytobacillus sp. IB215665]|uniref:hypothetical protein n=1 Tax=Cytobacillus sp. IB215665 TaxID=3097357 RepID=UPI002A0E2290|nr:hypothetical protein [Cytobacillus sp. IB215665]MDX8366111.1 hypothetical protein [Cytobacillus sp. IB215665]
MFLKEFFDKELQCTNCDRTLSSGDEIFISLTLPNERKMPIGVLDKVLSKHSNKVHCKTCYERIKLS